MTTTQPPGQPLFTKSTKFNDLPDQLKKTFEDIESVPFAIFPMMIADHISELTFKVVFRSAPN